MAFTIPNSEDALHKLQAQVDRHDLTIVLQALRGSGVFSECLVTASPTPDGAVTIPALGSNSYRVTGSDENCAGGLCNVLSGAANTDGSTSLAAHATRPRFDLIVLNKNSQQGVVHGSAGPEPSEANDYTVIPEFPDFDTATQIVVAGVYITPLNEATGGTIVPGDIVPKDCFISRSNVYDDPHALGGSHHTPTGLTNAQHGILSVASGHGHANLSGIGLNDHGSLGLPLGLGNATAATRYVGGNTSGPPPSGTWVKGDFTIDQTGRLWICTVAGSSGSAVWVSPSLNDHLTPVTFSHPGTLAVTTEATAPPDSALQWTNDFGRTLTLIAVRARLKTVNTGASVIVDLNLDGVTTMTGTKIVIAASASPPTTKQTTFSTNAIPDAGILSMNVDQIGSTIAGAGLVVTALLRG